RTRLPVALRVAGRAMLDHDARCRTLDDYQAKQQAQTVAAGWLDGMSVKERLRVFEALFPTISKHVEAGWQLQRALPYQTSGEKAFRAPHAPALVRQTRL